MSIYNSNRNEDLYDQGPQEGDYDGHVSLAHLDAIDKEWCENHCYFKATDIHRMKCPMYSEIDCKEAARVEAVIDMARGK